ncbi:virulence RhuM family protein [Flavobacterium sp. HXWNR69]|uniref:Virulence RhuM family protein n=1 Tax=Flavobacterium fragile TaxID=2949085 RepID=A0ABT0TJ81_9FLAO|nr:virulence RhuM family protein [Flavobacterium sp. HXWNR69]MCL9770460.1 virulence RhuM family protein [Flavobacterium sp. HXWNR69]
MEESLKKFLLYTAPTGEIRVDVLLQDESVWLTQKAIAELFCVVKSTVSEHLTNIYTTNELDETSTVRKIRTVQTEGNRTVNRDLDYYNLDAIISVGYRVNSAKATQFRIWATQALKEYIIKGFVLDDNRLKQGQAVFGKDYFKELLQRVRSIRASERRIYQQVTDIFAECCLDYDRNSEITKNFYAMIQNKFHFAITGNTAAEIIHKKANKTAENMGLTTWKNAPDGRILKQDVIKSKNYLDEKEIKQLERRVTSYFDYIEGLIERENTFTMEQLAESVNRFLNFNDYKILEGKGFISKLQADKKAIQEYEVFNKTQKIISDFDKQIKKLD